MRCNVYMCLSLIISIVMRFNIYIYVFIIDNLHSSKHYIYRVSQTKVCTPHLCPYLTTQLVYKHVHQLINVPN